jgi:hypothetical protein
MAAEAQSVTFAGAAFVNQGLVGVGRVPADAKDKLGDTLGGIGSGMVADIASWKRQGDTYKRSAERAHLPVRTPQPTPAKLVHAR